MSEYVIVLSVVKWIDTPRLWYVDKSWIFSSKLWIFPEIPAPDAYKYKCDLKCVDQELTIFVESFSTDDFVVN